MIKLSQLLKEASEEKRPLSLEVKKHFLEIVSTYNKYQESLDRKSDLQEIAETLGGITEAARTLAIHEGDDWFDKHTVKRNMSELDKLGKQFDKCAVEAKGLDQRMAGLYEDMGHILSRYYKLGEITEEQMKERLGMNESKSDCGCGCGGVTEGGCSTNVVEESVVNEGKKRFKQQNGIGKSKYTISYHDGKKKHKDGSYFFDIKIFKNKPELEAFKKDLVSKGFVKESVNESINEGKFKAEEFLDTIQVSNNKIKDFRDITVDATPKGNWNVYYKGKRLMTVDGKLLDDRTIMKYHLEKR